MVRGLARRMAGRARAWRGGAVRASSTAAGATPTATTADIEACYRLLLGRRPDADGYGHYCRLVEHGLRLEELVMGFLASPEFEARGLLSPGGEGVPAPTHLDGFTLYTWPDDRTIGHSISHSGTYEAHVTARLREVLAPGMTFVDVGASLGYYTVLARTLVGETGRVVAVEPGPRNCTLLLLNVTANGFRDVELHNVAVDRTPGVVRWSSRGSNGAIADFDGDPAQVAGAELVRAVPLDVLLSGASRVDVVKLDIEGAEFRALSGAEGVLRTHRPRLFLEFQPSALRDVSGVTGEDLLRLLVGHGYQFTTLSEPARACGQDIAAVLDAVERSTGALVDLLAEPAA